MLLGGAGVFALGFFCALCGCVGFGGVGGGRGALLVVLGFFGGSSARVRGCGRCGGGLLGLWGSGACSRSRSLWFAGGVWALGLLSLVRRFRVAWAGLLASGCWLRDPGRVFAGLAPFGVAFRRCGWRLVGCGVVWWLRWRVLRGWVAVAGGGGFGWLGGGGCCRGACCRRVFSALFVAGVVRLLLRGWPWFGPFLVFPFASGFSSGCLRWSARWGLFPSLSAWPVVGRRRRGAGLALRPACLWPLSCGSRFFSAARFCGFLVCRLVRSVSPGVSWWWRWRCR